MMTTALQRARDFYCNSRSVTTPPPGAQGERAWYRITNLAGEGGTPAEVSIYDEIGYWGVSAADFLNELKGVTATEITLRLNSPGGEIFDGIAIMNALRSHPATVTTHVDSLAASIASVIAMAGDRVVMQPHSQMMIHDASGLAIGNAADMRELADLLDRQSNNIAGVYAERAGGTVEEWRAVMLAETWYTAQEAVDAGLADEVAVPPGRDASGEPAAGQAAAFGQSVVRAVFRYADREHAPAPAPVVEAENHEPPVAADAAEAMRRIHAAGQKAAASNVMRQFDEGDRVAVIVPHEPGHTQGTIAVVNGNAYGIIFDTPDDDTAPGEPYKWYVDDELQFVAEGADRQDDEGDGDEGGGYGADQPAEAPLLPGVSHPNGVPTSQTDVAWADLVSHLTEPEPDDWSALISHLTEPASPQRGDGSLKEAL